MPHSANLSFEDQLEIIVAALRQTTMKQIRAAAKYESNVYAGLFEHYNYTAQLSYIRNGFALLQHGKRSQDADCPIVVP